MLKRKAIELFEDFNKVMETENSKSEKAKASGKEYTSHYYKKVVFGIIEVILNSSYDDDFQRVIEAYFRNYDASCSFPHSEEGFVAACEWIDEQREKIIEDIS